MAVSIGTYCAVNKVISYAEKINRRNYVFIEDVLGQLPLEMQHRITPAEREQRATPWDRADVQTPWDRPNTATPWEPASRSTPWD
jgi:hypothetical protein